jgi:uncharacterized protein (DUF885 family)
MNDDSANQLARLAARYWALTLETNPLLATSIGDRRFDRLLDDQSPDAVAARGAQLNELRVETEQLADDRLTPEDRTTRSALRESIAADLALIESGLHEWAVDPLEGPQVAFNDLEAFQPVRSPDEGRAMVERWREMGPWIDTAVDNARRAMADGRAAAREPVGRVIDELDDLLARPPSSWAMAKPAREDHPAWPPGELDRFRRDLGAAIEELVRPAFQRYRTFLHDELLRAARPSDRPGLIHVPGGPEAYRRQIRYHTSLDLQPQDLHATGVAEIARIDAEFVELGRRVLGTADLATTLARLREDPALYFTTRDEVFAKAQAALARARDAVPDWFGILPRSAVDVVRMEEHEEKHSTIAYYRQPATDGSRPGQFFINTYEPQTRPRYEAEALAYHESIPGHHLQIAIAQELDRLPDFRRHLGPGAYVEGWGLYTERLADEMGLYSGDLDRFGVLSFDAWRACRLVVDTGMHALGWTRGQAIEYMASHTALGDNNIRNEVDRYIVWPAQALGYKTGQLELLGLRAQLQARLGAKFEIRAFHDAVLGDGALPLTTLREIVDRLARDGSSSPS